MTEEELVSAYQSGQLSRRVFIRRLIQGGLSVTAALVYADSLAAPAGATNKNEHGYDEHYLHHHDHHHDQGGRRGWPESWWAQRGHHHP